MRLIPKTTTPLTKFIRTGEGILVFAFNIALLVVPIVSKALTPGEAVKWAGIIDAVAVASRTGLKVVSLFAQQTGIQPEPVNQGVVSADEGVEPAPAAPGAVAVAPGAVAAAPGANAAVPMQNLGNGAATGPVSTPLQADAQSVATVISDEEEFASVPSPSDVVPVTTSFDASPPLDQPQVVG